MKRSGTTITFIVVWAAVLFAALVIGICIREVRFQRAKIESIKNIEIKTGNRIQAPSETDQLVEGLAQKSPTPEQGGAERPSNIFPEGEPGSEELRGSMRERFANMTEEERAQMRERLGGRRRGGERFQNMTEEERARFREERGRMRERMENMSEEERREYMAQMRERFGGRRRGERRGSGDPNSEERQNEQEEDN